MDGEKKVAAERATAEKGGCVKDFTCRCRHAALPPRRTMTRRPSARRTRLEGEEKDRLLRLAHTTAKKAEAIRAQKVEAKHNHKAKHGNKTARSKQTTARGTKSSLGGRMEAAPRSGTDTPNSAKIKDKVAAPSKRAVRS